MISRQEQKEMGLIREYGGYVPKEDPRDKQEVVPINPIIPITPTFLSDETYQDNFGTKIEVIYKTSKMDAANAFLLKTIPTSIVSSILLGLAAIFAKTPIWGVITISFLGFLFVMTMMFFIDSRNSPESVARYEQQRKYDRLIQQDRLRAEILMERIRSETDK